MGNGNWWLLELPECLNCSKMSSSLYLGRGGLLLGEPQGTGECGEEEDVDFLLPTASPCSEMEEGDTEGCLERCWGDTLLQDGGEESGVRWFCAVRTPGKAMGDEGGGEDSGLK